MNSAATLTNMHCILGDNFCDPLIVKINILIYLFLFETEKDTSKNILSFITALAIFRWKITSFFMSNSNQFHIKSKDLLERLTGYCQWFKKAMVKG